MINSFFRLRLKLPLLIGISLLLSACANLDLDSARSLSASGSGIAQSARTNLFASRLEFQDAIDGEAIVHGYTGTTTSPAYLSNLNKFDTHYKEITSRGVVFDRLASVYQDLGTLADIETPTDIEASLGELAGAVNNYHSTIGSGLALSPKSTTLISHIGGFLAEQRRKKMVLAASARIRTQLHDMVNVMENSTVKRQLVGFRKVLVSSQKSAVSLLMSKNVFDSSMVFSTIGESVGLSPIDDPSHAAYADPAVTDASKEVINQRFRNKYINIEESYDAVVNGLKWLIAEHKKLEKGKEMDLVKLTVIITELQYLTDLHHD
jgi:hypothetical protein